MGFEGNDNLEPEETYNKTVGESDDEPEEKTHKAYISEDVPARAGKPPKKNKPGFPKALSANSGGSNRGHVRLYTV